MVKQWGMSEKAGLRTVEDNSNSIFVVNDLSATTSELMDAEIKRILQVKHIVHKFQFLMAFASSQI
jgi:ATP-dependent Zn protease